MRRLNVGLSTMSQLTRLLSSRLQRQMSRLLCVLIHQSSSFFTCVSPAICKENTYILTCNAQVTIAGRYGIPFLATGGGHGLSITLANVHNGIEIDLSKFKNVTVDTIANTVTVGGANVFGDVFAPVWSAGKEMSMCSVLSSSR